MDTLPDIPSRPNRTIRLALTLARLALVLAVLWQGARSAFRYDPRDDLRRVDALFVAGRYHDALDAATGLAARAPRFPPALVRLGMLRALRDERPAASRSLAQAVGLGLSEPDRDLARLYQGRVAATAGQHDEARQFWAVIDARSPLFPLRRVLEAESLLAVGDYAGAEAAYRAALLPDLPPGWRALVHTRLAALRASSDRAGALAELAQAGAPALWTQRVPAIDDLAAPLLPAAQPDARQLAVALRLDDGQRAQMLGQLYLDAGLYVLAEAQFAAAATDSPSALAAGAFAAYTRWRAGDQDAGRRQLEALVAAHPQEPRARALLALTYLFDRDASGAQAQLDAIRALAPRAPDTHLAWAQWYAAQHDYLTAAAEYRRALDDASADDRGSYALALARFHLDTSLNVCVDGRPAAEEAARLLPDDQRAWVVLAATRFTCGDNAGARTAAQAALLRGPGSAEAAYYLGRALAALGDRPSARAALVSAADMAPASPWRERAETQLVTLGL